MMEYSETHFEMASKAATRLRREGSSTLYLIYLAMSPLHCISGLDHMWFTAGVPDILLAYVVEFQVEQNKLMIPPKHTFMEVSLSASLVRKGSSAPVSVS
jgi:hypothetical protein